MSLDSQVAVMKMPYSQKEKREKQGCHASRWEQRLFTSCLPGAGERDIHFSMDFVPFSLVYAPPADLIMSMPPETCYNKFSPLQWHLWWKQHWADPGSSSRFLELAAAPVPPWTVQIRFATLKGENGTLREGAGLGTSPLGGKARLGWS